MLLTVVSFPPCFIGILYDRETQGKPYENYAGAEWNATPFIMLYFICLAHKIWTEYSRVTVSNLRK